MEQVQNKFWFAARTRFGQELKVRDRLVVEQVEHFVPIADSRKRTKAAIPCLVFLKTTKAEALDLANTGRVPIRYMIDCATHTLLVVPDKQMDDFRRVMDCSIEEGGLVDQPLSLGERVRVTKGALRGVEGHVLELLGRTYVVVGLLGCIWAKAKVPRAYLEKVGKE